MPPTGPEPRWAQAASPRSSRLRVVARRVVFTTSVPLRHAVAFAVGQDLGMVGAQFAAGAGLQILEQIVELCNRANLQAEALSYILHRAPVDVLAAVGGLFLAIEGD